MALGTTQPHNHTKKHLDSYYLCPCNILRLCWFFATAITWAKERYAGDVQNIELNAYYDIRLRTNHDNIIEKTLCAIQTLNLVH